mmetsp:Transcript_16982/g.26996  ORF Transcript_16982/g.26996 Transcript_16982/m.26996 type:complete len:120 (+) Transcript_16982:122-481(+)
MIVGHIGAASAPVNGLLGAGCCAAGCFRATSCYSCGTCVLLLLRVNPPTSLAVAVPQQHCQMRMTEKHQDRQRLSRTEHSLASARLFFNFGESRGWSVVANFQRNPTTGGGSLRPPSAK